MDVFSFQERILKDLEIIILKQRKWSYILKFMKFMQNQRLNNTDFWNWIIQLKTKIHNAKNKIAFSLNSQILELYWEMWKEVAEKQANSNWWDNFIEQISWSHNRIIISKIKSLEIAEYYFLW